MCISVKDNSQYASGPCGGRDGGWCSAGDYFQPTKIQPPGSHGGDAQDMVKFVKVVERQVQECTNRDRTIWKNNSDSEANGGECREDQGPTVGWCSRYDENSESNRPEHRERQNRDGRNYPKLFIFWRKAIEENVRKTEEQKRMKNDSTCQTLWQYDFSNNVSSVEKKAWPYCISWGNWYPST